MGAMEQQNLRLQESTIMIASGVADLILVLPGLGEGSDLSYLLHMLS